LGFGEAALTFLNTTDGFRRNQAIIKFPNAISRTVGQPGQPVREINYPMRVWFNIRRPVR
jgi:hypothetical protein